MFLRSFDFSAHFSWHYDHSIMMISVLFLASLAEGSQHLYREAECCICLSAKPKFVLRPCGHLCVCKSCIKRRLLTCPLCVTIIKEKEEIEGIADEIVPKKITTKSLKRQMAVELQQRAEEIKRYLMERASQRPYSDRSKADLGIIEKNIEEWYGDPNIVLAVQMFNMLITILKCTPTRIPLAILQRNLMMEIIGEQLKLTIKLYREYGSLKSHFRRYLQAVKEQSFGLGKICNMRTNAGERLGNVVRFCNKIADVTDKILELL